MDVDACSPGEISSLASLRENPALAELFLTGNPCSLFTHYRPFVVWLLPQLAVLDGIPVERSERILARQQLHLITASVRQEEQRHREKRELEKQAVRYYSYQVFQDFFIVC